MARRDAHEAARGRWRAILAEFGVPPAALTGKHTACPCCGGKDRFRFDDKAGRGTFICGQCGSGTGFDLVMKLRGVPFAEAMRLVLLRVDRAPLETPKATPKNQGDFAKRIVETWTAARPLSGIDAASKYLAKRGLKFTKYPTELRFDPRAAHYAKDGKRSYHPALIARFAAPDAKGYTIQTTYLTDIGEKAFRDGCRKLAPGCIPLGGAVRLANSAETMGVAEGVETALSAAQMFDVPVWACLTAGALVKWKPPPSVKHVLIFADADVNFTGQAAAYALAHRLALEKLSVEVRMPDEIGTDWNDVLQRGGWSAPRGKRPAHELVTT